MKYTFAVVIALLSSPALRAAEEAEEKVETEVSVRVALIQKATLRRYITGYGTVELAPAQGGQPAASAKVASAVAGVVMEAMCEEGQQVAKGAPLFRLDSRLADLAVQKAQQAIALAQQNSERQEKLVKIEGTSQKQVLEAEAQLSVAKSELATAEAQANLARITAPIRGTVMKVNARVGESVDLTTALAEIADLERLTIAVQVPTAEAVSLKSGMTAEASAGKDGKPIIGQVAYVSPSVDSANDTVLVRVSLPKETGLRAGQFVSVRIVSEERKDLLAVPAESVVKDEEEGTVISLVEGDKATRKAVKTGLRDGELVEVSAEGLKEGLNVVTIGAYGLPKETKVKVLK